MPFKDFTSETLSSSDVDTHLMRQAVMTFTDTSARDTALDTLEEDGMLVRTVADSSYWWWNGTDWKAFATPWVSFTPTWSNFTVGASDIDAYKRYEYGDLLVRVRVSLAAGFSITGTLGMTLPDSVTADDGGGWGVGVLNDSGTQNFNCSVHVDPASASVVLSHNGGVVNATSPHTWANGDFFGFELRCPPAA